MFQRVGLRHALLNQIGAPEMAGAPGNRAMQEHLSFGGSHRLCELRQRFRRVGELRITAHGQVDVCHAEVRDQLRFIEADAFHL